MAGGANPMSGYFADWPKAGPIDLAVHYFPHASSMTEWWYVNAHVETDDGRPLSLFAAFFRMRKATKKPTDAPEWVYSLTWALSDPSAKAYYPDSRVRPERAGRRARAHQERARLEGRPLEPRDARGARAGRGPGAGPRVRQGAVHLQRQAGARFRLEPGSRSWRTAPTGYASRTIARRAAATSPSR